MKDLVKRWNIVAAFAIFVGLPLLFYGLGDFPRRSLLKECLSLLTVLSFTLMLGQFFLARSNPTLLSLFKPINIQRVHKTLAYVAMSILL
ncbi:hypothetical protein, partial [Alteromonas sp. 14N.309.X.WAT.G.H12]|uniref:hypothetical protein n=1 Tax=Alteromonas sp. 14N.309.X.WAT.G.H12 TaxID=3120824 RepID=UPI002FCE7456